MDFALLCTCYQRFVLLLTAIFLLIVIFIKNIHVNSNNIKKLNCTNCKNIFTSLKAQTENIML